MKQCNQKQETLPSKDPQEPLPISQSPKKFKWHSQPMGPAKIDILDKDALYRILDEEFYPKK